MKILLLEDDIVLQEIIEEFLEELNYSVSAFYDGESALASISNDSYDLLLLDVNVPKINGFEILSYLRDIGNQTPTIYITSLSSIKDLQKGFSLGADDYLKKPFDLEELEVRIEHIIKIYNLQDSIKIGDIYFKPQYNTLLIDGKDILIRKKESAVLEYFIHHQNRVVSCDELIENLWHNDTAPTDSTIRTYIKNIRRVLGKDYISNIKGEGYRFNIV